MLRTAALVLLSVALASSRDLPQIYPPETMPGKTPLYFGLLQSFGGQYNSSGSIPGVELALDRINANPSVLRDYSLHYVLRDTSVSKKTTLKLYFVFILFLGLSISARCGEKRVGFAS